MIAGHFPFWMAEEEGRVLGVMGIQDRGAVALVGRDVRRVNDPEEGRGTKLLRHVRSLADKPILIMSAAPTRTA